MLLWASPANLLEREIVRGIGGTIRMKNWTVLMPLESNEYQMLTAHIVDDLLYVPKVCTNMVMDLVRQ